VLQLVKVIRKGKNVQIGRAGGQGVTFGTMWNYASFLYHLPPGHFVQAKIEGLSGLTDLYTDPSNITRAVQEFMNPDVEAPAKATAAALGERYHPKPHGLRPSTVTVTVLNGNGRTGAASNGTYLLAQRGYHVLSPPSGATANAPSWTYVRSKAYYDPAQPRSRTAAAQLATLIGDTDVAPLPPEVEPTANGAMVVVVLGRTFQDKLALPPPSTTTPKHEPAYVTYDPSATRPLLWRIRPRVRFRLELPTVIQRASRPDWEEPIRVYSIAGRKAVRIVYSTGIPGDYWGVEETNWDEAPALSERNIERHLGRRTFDFYYSGTHLHMIVLRANGATYWVVNTLVDSLSNETMVAIAKGLRPL
jgi:hypothetical protein